MDSSANERELLIQVLTKVTQVSEKTKHIEDMLKDNKEDLKVLRTRVNELEAYNNKLTGIAVLIPLVITLFMPYIQKIIGD